MVPRIVVWILAFVLVLMLLPAVLAALAGWGTTLIILSLIGLIGWLVNQLNRFDERQRQVAIIVIALAAIGIGLLLFL